MPARTPEELVSLLIAAFNGGDLDAYMELYEPNAVFVMPPEGTEARGKEEIRVATKPLLTLESNLQITVVRQIESDGLALSQTRWTLVGTDSERNRVELSDRGTIVSRRQPDGSWLIVLENPVSPD